MAIIVAVLIKHKNINKQAYDEGYGFEYYLKSHVVYEIRQLRKCWGNVI